MPQVIESHRDRGTQEPAVPDHPAAAAEQGADDQGDGEEAHAVVVSHTEARDQAPASHQRQSPVRPILATTSARPAHARHGGGIIKTRVWDSIRTATSAGQLGFVPDALVETGSTKPTAHPC
jgi:hypothetical protein